MKLHILTAVSRPENLPRIAESLATAAERAPNVTLAWHWRFDLDRQHIGGQALKNAMLDEIEDGWVWILDDDTLVHPDVFAGLSEEWDAVVVSQQRTDGRVLYANQLNVCPGSIDAGQAFMRRTLIGELRIPETYEGDGEWLEFVLSGARVKWVAEPLSFHNAISGVNVSV